MRRNLPVHLLLVLLAAAGVYLSRPVLCPGCEGAGQVDRRSGFAPVNPGCPRCEDEGQVTRAGRLLRRAPHPDVMALFRGAWFENDYAQEDFERALRRLIERSGLKIDVGEDPHGRVVYLHDGVDVMLPVFE